MPQESLNLPYLTLTSVVFAVIVVSFVVFRPQIEDIKTTRAEISKTSEKLAERQQFLQSIDQKSAQLRANAGLEQELSVLLPADESFDDVLRVIDRQGLAAAVFIKNIDNTTASTQRASRVAKALGTTSDLPETLTVHGVNIGVQGSYQQIRQFITLLENSIRFMDISKLNLNATLENGDVIDGFLTANFYSLSSPK